MHDNNPIVVLRLVGNRKPSLPAKERSRVRAMVHQFSETVESGGDLTQLLARLPSVRGHAHKVKMLHPTEGAKLVMQVKRSADLLSERVVAKNRGATSCSTGAMPMSVATAMSDL